LVQLGDYVEFGLWIADHVQNPLCLLGSQHLVDYHVAQLFCVLQAPFQDVLLGADLFEHRLGELQQ